VLIITFIEYECILFVGKSVNFVEKSSKIIWWFRKHAISLHPLSPLKWRVAQNWFLEIFLKKKVTKKFGSFKNMIYLCTAFPLLKRGVKETGSSSNRI
jgi:hypothetical protein